MDYKNEMNSDDDFDNSNGFSDSYGSNSTNSQNGFGQSQVNTNGMSKAELRKTNKPIMEKRRRARINHCLNELKSLILEAMKKDPARHTKLEKADILEMTVKHLQSVQRQQLNMAIQTDPTVIHKFKTGFVECAEEVNRYVNQLDGIDTGVRQRLSNHLKNCATSLEQIGSMSNFNSGYRGQLGGSNGGGTNNGPLNANNIFGGLTNALGVNALSVSAGVGVAANPLVAATATITAPGGVPLFPPLPQDLNNNNSNNLNGVGANLPATPIQMGGVQLIPSRLPSGEFALIMPNTVNNANVTNHNSNNNNNANNTNNNNSSNNNASIFGPFTSWSSNNPLAATTTAPTALAPQRLSAFTKPTPQQQQQQQLLQQTPKVGMGVIAPTAFHQSAVALNAIHHHQQQQQPHQAHNHHQQQPQHHHHHQPHHHHHHHHNTNAITNNSPPLSPISSTASISSHGDDSSIMHTSSDFAASRPATPPTANNSISTNSTNNNININHSFSGVFSTPSSADSSTLSSNTSLSNSLTSSGSTRSSVHLQQQQVSSTSGSSEAIATVAASVAVVAPLPLKRRALHTEEAADSSDSSDEPSAKKFAAAAPLTPPPTTTTTSDNNNTDLNDELVDEAAGTEKWERETREKETCSSMDDVKFRQRPELLDERDSMWRPW